MAHESFPPYFFSYLIHVYLILHSHNVLQLKQIPSNFMSSLHTCVFINLFCCFTQSVNSISLHGQNVSLLTNSHTTSSSLAIKQASGVQFVPDTCDLAQLIDQGEHSGGTWESFSSPTEPCNYAVFKDTLLRVITESSVLIS